MTRAYHDLLKRQGRNPFYSAALPKATMRLRQGVGRLIRTADDYGVAAILDSRLHSRRYGATILKSFPKDLPIKELPTDQLVEVANNFIKKNHRRPEK